MTKQEAEAKVAELQAQMADDVEMEPLLAQMKELQGKLDERKASRAPKAPGAPSGNGIDLNSEIKTPEQQKQYAAEILKALREG